MIRQAGKQANRIVLHRTGWLMAIFGIVIFIPLIFQLYKLQIVQHDELEEKAVRQQTSQSSITAVRGSIMDANGNVLAVSSTAYDVIISPKAIMEKQDQLTEKLAKAKAKGKDTTPYNWNVKDVVCQNLSQILNLDEGELREKCSDTESQYKRLAQKINKTTEDQIREVMDSYGLAGCIYLQPNTKRYYPYGTLAAQVIGFANDNGGAYGLESMYDNVLSGKPGLIVTAKNRDGTDLMNFFQDYYDAENGSSIYLTLDTTIQSYCENYLKKYCDVFDVQHGGAIVVMECKTGAILGMAALPGYDLNNYGKITDESLLAQVEKNAKKKVEDSQKKVQEAIDRAKEEGTEPTEEERTVLDYDTAYNEAYAEGLSTQWTNRVITDSYEPGSTFKAMVLAAGLEEGVIDENSTFDCGGNVYVGDWPNPIWCSNKSGHGHQTLAEAIGHSCNPALIAIAGKLGRSTFYDYLHAFGVMEPTGIDLPYEGTSNVWPREDFGIVDLAVASFGQRFTLTPIQLITAFNSVVNGGYLYKPHVVESIVDSTGNVTYEADTTATRQVISEETSRRCCDILEGVVTKYTGKNAYKPGYRIGGKTGSAQTLVADETVVSFVGFAPADDPDIITLVIFDSPKPAGAGDSVTAGGYSISGGAMAGTVAGDLIADVLDYRGYEKAYSSDDLTGKLTEMPNLSGQTANEASLALKNKQLEYRTVGGGDTVTGQIPAAGNYVPQNSTVILYMGEEAPTDSVEVPDLTGMSPKEAIKALNELGLFMSATGTSGYYSSATACSGQETEPGTKVYRGYIVKVSFSDASADNPDEGGMED